jgi:hypothetical protein
MTKDRFPAFCSHFVKNLPEGQGKGGLPVILIFDGHASRWNFTGLKLLLENNVYCLCLPGHTSIWSQPNDGGANASWKSTIGDAISAWRRKHRPLPGSESILKMTRADWNLIYSTAWIKWKRQQTQLLRDVGSNSITTGWAGTGLAPYTRDAPYWDAALSKWGRRDELSKSAPVGGMGGGGSGWASAGHLPEASFRRARRSPRRSARGLDDASRSARSFADAIRLRADPRACHACSMRAAHHT